MQKKYFISMCYFYSSNDGCCNNRDQFDSVVSGNFVYTRRSMADLFVLTLKTT